MNKGFTLIIVLISVVILALLSIYLLRGSGSDKGAIETKKNAEVDIQKIEKQIKGMNDRIKEVE